jgi:hypothetical protein
VRWEYEPHTFVFERGTDGQPTAAFTPDFWLPDHQRYLEVTTMDQRLVTRKHRKVRRLRALHPEVDVTLVYQRDYLRLLARFGLEPPEQRSDLTRPEPASEPLGLLGLGTLPYRGGTADSVA